ncbi:carboxymuconolactone decarboxylase family protein [Plastoroseomonas hellenica]|uniref:carboxymuconolactone decarboxylase family protein n=1 Tax=Plastoroseomonas hellenica TaxID=2687306 RepID=UPI001BAD4850|nr:carboxymuconolactone decarboxylase family protein [Plastoroseomonas hellenica]MBR0643912.1 carboxymuconolactone decarboxylase family protein [Plastoroseomonas hellenica]
MTPRLNPQAAAPEMIRAMLALENAVAEAGVERSLYELVKTRASQINGCAFCLHMHTNDARRLGETEDRLHLLAAWRESPLYSDRERAALGWTEALTRLADTHAPDADYQALKAQFTEKEQVVLTMMIVTINGWNRLAVGFRAIHPVTVARAA